MEKLKRPLIPHLLYKWFGIETARYKQYWKRYCEIMQFELNKSRTINKSKTMNRPLYN